MASDMDRLRDEFPEDGASGGASVSGWTRRAFLFGRMAGVARCDGPLTSGCYALAGGDLDPANSISPGSLLIT